jgi:hypothetical protein
MPSTTTKRAGGRRTMGRLGLSLPSSAVAFVALFAFAANPGCGARGPLDDTPYDAGSDVTVVTVVDAAPEAAEEAAVDASRPPTLATCGQCLFDQCGAPVLACAQSQGCRATVQCIATTCVSSGAPDLPCILKCAASSGGLEPALGVFTCVTNTCGEDCTSVLGGLLGGGGGGGRDAGGPGP